MDAKIKAKKHWVYGSAINFIFCIFICSALGGCASSAVSRDAANRVDSAYERSSDIVRNDIIDGAPVEGFQNSSEIYQGAVLGGLTGAIAGGLYTSGTVGVIPGAIGGAVVGGVFGAFVEHHSNLIDQIENRGGQVFVLGDQVMIVLPSTQIFRGVSPVLQPRAYSTLDLVAKLISGYHSMLVKVAANSYGDGTREVELSASQEQADTVVKYLSRHADTRLISGVGYGGARLVDKRGANVNYRLEISLEKLPT